MSHSSTPDVEPGLSGHASTNLKPVSDNIRSIPPSRDSSRSLDRPASANILGQNSMENVVDRPEGTSGLECDRYVELSGVGNSSGNWDDPSNKLWSTYVTQAEKHDETMTDSWKVDTDGSLIFAGLFSAVVTGFLVGSLQMLQPNSGDAIVALLTQISQQQRSGSTNFTVNGSDNQSATFKPAASVVWANSLWMASLIVALASALISTLIQQWSRNYRRLVASRSQPRDRGRIRNFYYEGVQRFGLQAVVKSLPLLLQTAVFLFLAGIVIFVMPMDPTVHKVALGLTVVIAVVYVIFTCLPALYHNCPFRTPISIIPRIIISQSMQLFNHIRYSLARFWHRLKYVEVSGRRAAIEEDVTGSPHEDQSSIRSRIRPSINPNLLYIICTFMRARLDALRAFLSLVRPDAPLPSYDPDGTIMILWGGPRRDCAALTWTIRTLPDDKELESFVEGISDFVTADSSNARTIINLFHVKDPDLGERMTSLLWTCTGPSILHDDRRICRTTAVLRAIRRTVTDPWLSYLLDSFDKESPLECLVTPFLLELLQADPVTPIAAQVLCTSLIIICTFSHELLHPEIGFARKLWWDRCDGAQAKPSSVDAIWRRASVISCLGGVSNIQDVIDSSVFTFGHLWGVMSVAAEHYRASDAFEFNQTRQIRLAHLMSIEEEQIRQFVSTPPLAVLVEPLKEWVFSTSLVALAAFLQALVENDMKANAYTDDTELVMDTARIIFHSITCASADDVSGANKILAMILVPITHGLILSASVLKSLLTSLERTAARFSADYARVMLQVYAQCKPDNVKTVNDILELLPPLTSNQDQAQAPLGFQIALEDFESRRPPTFQLDRHRTLGPKPTLMNRAWRFLRDNGISRNSEVNSSPDQLLPRYIERDVYQVTGRPFYLYRATRSTSWQIPETISTNVDRYFTADGIPYYMDHSTWTTSWEPPAESTTISSSNGLQPAVHSTAANIDYGPPPPPLYSRRDIEMEDTTRNPVMQLPGWLIW